MENKANLVDLILDTANGGDLPVVVCNADGKAAMIQRYVLMGIINGATALFKQDKPEKIIDIVRTLWNAVCDVAHDPE